MERDLELFFERLLTDSDFRDKFLTAKTAYEGYELAKEYIPNVSFDEFREGVLIADKRIKEEKQRNRELSFSEFQDVSGGVESLIKNWSM